MIRLHEDRHFQSEIIRALSKTAYYGADIGEVFAIIPNLKKGDVESWYEQWSGLAKRVLSTIDESKPESYSPVTLRSVYFRASEYLYLADFYLHGNPADPRILECSIAHRTYFNKANELLPIPGKRYTVPGDDFTIPIMVFRASEASASRPRPTLLVGGGFDSSMEETMHVFGFAALERGYNFIMYEGPGQTTVLQQQGKGFIYDWERVVSPIMDHLVNNNETEFPFLDPKKIGLVGWSLGGYLSARAAAFEPRLAALMCIDGVYDAMTSIWNLFPQGKEAFLAGDKKEFDRLFEEKPETWPTSFRWVHDQMLYTCRNDSAYDALTTGYGKMNLGNGVAEKIRMPAYIVEATQDVFFKGEPERVVKAIGKNAELHVMDEEQAAQYHCAAGAFVYQNQSMMEWFAGVVGH